MEKIRKFKFDKDVCALNIKEYTFFYDYKKEDYIMVCVKLNTKTNKLSFFFENEHTYELTQQEKEHIIKDLTKRIKSHKVSLISTIFFENTKDNLLNGDICKDFEGKEWYEHNANDIK